MKKRVLPKWLLEKEASDAGNISNLHKQARGLYEDYPSLKFCGRIVQCYNIIDFGIASEELLNKYGNLEEIVLGFDMEWPINGKTAIIQICSEDNLCYIFHVHQIPRLPIAFLELLKHPKVKLAGLNISGDLWKLGRDFSISVLPMIKNNAVELKLLANEVLKTNQTWSLAGLAVYLLKQCVEKQDSIRLSDWKNRRLSSEQLNYAATDSYASLLLYKKLISMRKSS